MTENIFTYLDEVRLRPGMYIRDERPGDLEPVLHGYYTALRTHGIVEEGPKMMQDHFATWLSKKIKISGMALGWGNMLEEKFGRSEGLLDKFFEYVDDYRQLKSRYVAHTESHLPTRKHTRIEIYNYVGTTIYFPIYNRVNVRRVISGIPKPTTDQGAIKTFVKRNSIPDAAGWHFVT